MAIFNSYVSLPEGNPGFQHSKLLFHQGFISQKKNTISLSGIGEQITIAKSPNHPKTWMTTWA
jgi:hypothetical protein